MEKHTIELKHSDEGRVSKEDTLEEQDLPAKDLEATFTVNVSGWAATTLITPRIEIDPDRSTAGDQ